jgi:glyoxylase-like metal-dependent hydrolase (beta-lactamase superfamily II)
LIFAGDAAKNQAELATGKVDMTLDPSASRASIDRLRNLAAEDPANIIVCGHDRLLGLSEGRLVHHGQLTAAVSARLSADFEEETVIDLVSAERAVRASGADTNLVQ